jgi:hypothetical protein
MRWLLAPAALACSHGTPTANYDPKLDAASFVAGVTNPLFPLVPGTVLRYDGQAESGAEVDSIVVTSDAKTILGIQSVVVRDRSHVNGALEEETLDWYAQDRDGNVWYLGEDSKQYEHGVLVSTDGSWEAGKAGAKAGIIMKGSPKAGDAYRQEYSKGIAEDRASVLGIDEAVTVPYGAFTHCVLTEDWSALEDDVREHKYYCPGVGVVRELTVRGGSEHLELTSVSHP